MKIIAGILMGMAVGWVAVAKYWREGFAEPPTFRTSSVERGDLFIGVTATGTVEPVQIIDVGAQIVGSIQSFGPDPDRPGETIDYCSRVTKGAVLAHLDDLPHRAELDKVIANLRLAEAELNRSRATLKQMELAYSRAHRLRGTNSEASFEKAMADHEAAKAEIAMAEAKVEQAKIAKKQAEINLDYTVIRAPVDGMVIDRRVNVGQTVVAGMNAPSLFLLAEDLSQMLVWAAVNEADIGDIRLGQPVTFTVDAYRDLTFSGTVKQIRLNASLHQNVVTYGVIVDVENPDGKLLPYMTAKLQFELDRRKDVVLVPNQALRWQPAWEQISTTARDGLSAAQGAGDHQEKPGHTADDAAERQVDPGTPTVWTVAEDGFVRPVPVSIGLSDGIVTEVLSGDLKPGDVVVTGVERTAEPDFVSKFVTPVTEPKD